MNPIERVTFLNHPKKVTFAQLPGMNFLLDFNIKSNDLNLPPNSKMGKIPHVFPEKKRHDFSAKTSLPLKLASFRSVYWLTANRTVEGKM